jgi:hypothetical protein
MRNLKCHVKMYKKVYAFQIQLEITQAKLMSVS